MSLQKPEIREKLADIFRQVLGREIANEDFQNDSGLIAKLNIDSLMGLQIIVKIEQTFNLVIEDDDFAIKMLDSIDQALEFIEKSMNQSCA
jgi:acyl carrier protein